MPNPGDKVSIRPAPSHMPTTGTYSMVLADPISGRFLAKDGEEVVWNAHHAQRFAHGEIVVIEPLKSSAAPIAQTEK